MKNFIFDLGKFDIKAILYDENGGEIFKFRIGSLFKADTTLPKFGKISEGVLQCTYKDIQGIFGVGDTFIDPVETEWALAIVKSICDRYITTNLDFKLVLLIPIGDFDKENELVKRFKEVLDMDIEVLPQAGFVITDGLIIDIGGGTTDYIKMKNGNLVDAGSLHLGMKNTLYDLRRILNEKTHTDHNLEYLRDLLINPVLTIEGKKIPVARYRENILNTFWNSLNTQIITRLKAHTNNVHIIGASVPLFEEYIKKEPNYTYNSSAFLSIDSTEQHLIEIER